MISAASNEKCFEYRGLSTDTKPTENVQNGTVFVEMDTSKVFMYDAEHKTWVLVKFNAVII